MYIYIYIHTYIRTYMLAAYVHTYLRTCVITCPNTDIPTCPDIWEQGGGAGELRPSIGRLETPANCFGFTSVGLVHGFGSLGFSLCHVFKEGLYV